MPSLHTMTKPAPGLMGALADAHEWIEGRLADEDFASNALPLIMDAAAAGPPREPIQCATCGWKSTDGHVCPAAPKATPDKVSGECLDHAMERCSCFTKLSNETQRHIVGSLIAAPPAASADKWQPLPDLERGEQAIELTSGPLQPAASADKHIAALHRIAQHYTDTDLAAKHMQGIARAALSPTGASTDYAPAASAAPAESAERIAPPEERPNRMAADRVGHHTVDVHDVDVRPEAAGLRAASGHPPTPDDGRSDAEVAREHIGRLLTEIFGATGGTDHWHPENALRKAVLDARAFIATQPAKTGSGK